MNEGLKAAQNKTAVQVTVAKELQRPEVSKAFRTKEMMLERQKSYNRFFKGWSTHISEILRLLKKGHIINPTEKIAAWRLCADWEIKERKFLEENEHLLEDAVQDVKDEFLKDEFDDLPEKEGERIMAEFLKKKTEVFHWLANEIRASYAKFKEEG